MAAGDALDRPRAFVMCHHLVESCAQETLCAGGGKSLHVRMIFRDVPELEVFVHRRAISPLLKVDLRECDPRAGKTRIKIERLPALFDGRVVVVREKT